MTNLVLSIWEFGYVILSKFDPKKFEKLLNETPDELKFQCISLFGWFILITLIIPACFFVICWILHLILYHASSWYHIRQNKGMAVRNVIKRILSASSKQAKEIQDIIDKEYKHIQKQGSWFSWMLPAICLGGYPSPINKIK